MRNNVVNSMALVLVQTGDPVALGRFQSANYVWLGDRQVDGFASTQELAATLRDCTTNLLLAKPECSIKANWTAALEKASNKFELAAATGRWLTIRDKAKLQRDSSIEAFEDLTPSLINKYVIDWQPSVSFHCVFSRRLPDNFLWISSKYVQTLADSLDVASDYTGALTTFFEIIHVSTSARCAYLPDLVATDMSFMAPFAP